MKNLSVLLSSLLLLAVLTPSQALAEMPEAFQRGDASGESVELFSTPYLTVDDQRRWFLDGPLGMPYSESGQDPNYLRALLWLAKAQGWGTFWYLSADELNSRDWDYQGLYADLPDALPQGEKWRNFNGLRFDDNVMYMNTPLHPMAGAGYYILARSSRLGIWASILATNLTSLFWEAAVEHHEVLSINDMLFTGIGGIPLGEAYIQLGEFFRRGNRTPLNQALSWIFAAPLQLHDLLDGTGTHYRGGFDEMGWPEEIWHRFRLSTGYSFGLQEFDSDQTRHDGEIALTTELVRLPEFQQRARDTSFQTGPAMTNLSASLAAGPEGVANWHLAGELHFAGWYGQRAGQVGEEPSLSSYWLGTGLGLRHDQHQYGDFRDRMGIIHFPGLRTDLSYLAGPLDLRLRYGIHADFSALDSFGLPDFQAQGGSSNRTVLEDFGYYYGLGFSSLLHAEVGVGPLRAEYQHRYHFSRSINALDRFYDDEDLFGPDLDEYATFEERLHFQELSLFYKTPLNSLSIGALGQARHRSGDATSSDALESASTRSRDLRLLGVLRLEL